MTDSVLSSTIKKTKVRRTYLDEKKRNMAAVSRSELGADNLMIQERILGLVSFQIFGGNKFYLNHNI